MSIAWKYIRYILPLWMVGLLTNFLPDHDMISRIRGWLASLFIRKCGRGFQLGAYVTILSPENLYVGALVTIARGTWLNCSAGLFLEDHVVMGPYVVISTSQHQFKDSSVRLGGSIDKPVRIGRGTWIGAHASVKCGVKVGSGNLIGANACVVKDTEPNVVVGGVPAKVIKANVS